MKYIDDVEHFLFLETVIKSLTLNKNDEKYICFGFQTVLFFYFWN